MPSLPDWSKKVLAILAAVCGVVIIQWPGTIYAQVATVVLAILSGLGITSGGTSNQRSDVARAAHEELVKKVLAP